MTIHDPKDHIAHIAGIWAQSAKAIHDHKRGAENCPTCGPKMSERHNHDNGISGCPTCKPRLCGNPTCQICA